MGAMARTAGCRGAEIKTTATLAGPWCIKGLRVAQVRCTKTLHTEATAGLPRACCSVSCRSPSNADESTHHWAQSALVFKPLSTAAAHPVAAASAAGQPLLAISQLRRPARENLQDITVMHHPIPRVGTDPADHLKDQVISNREVPVENRFVMCDAIAQIA